METYKLVLSENLSEHRSTVNRFNRSSQEFYVSDHILHIMSEVPELNSLEFDADVEDFTEDTKNKIISKLEVIVSFTDNIRMKCCCDDNPSSLNHITTIFGGRVKWAITWSPVDVREGKAISLVYNFLLNVKFIICTTVCILKDAKSVLEDTYDLKYMLPTKRVVEMILVLQAAFKCGCFKHLQKEITYHYVESVIYRFATSEMVV